jgi:hypothetical protein
MLDPFSFILVDIERERERKRRERVKHERTVKSEWKMCTISLFHLSGGWVLLDFFSQNFFFNV